MILLCGKSSSANIFSYFPYIVKGIPTALTGLFIFLGIYTWWILAFLFGVYIYLLSPLSAFIKVLRKIKKSAENLIGSKTISFDDDGIVLSTSASQKKVNWKDVVLIEESRKLFIFYPKGKTEIFFPKRFLKTDPSLHDKLKKVIWKTPETEQNFGKEFIQIPITEQFYRKPSRIILEKKSLKRFWMRCQILSYMSAL